MSDNEVRSASPQELPRRRPMARWPLSEAVRGILLVASGAAVGAAVVMVVLTPHLWPGALGLGLGGLGGLAAVLLRGRDGDGAELALIREAIREMPIPVAIYDADERLVACSYLYMKHHPVAVERLDLWNSDTRPTYSELVAASFDLDLSKAERQARLNTFFAAQPPEDGMLHERYFPGLGWIRVGKTRLGGGGTVRAAIDVNELKARETELEQALELAKASDSAKSKFLATMSHEVRTPLNGVIGLAEVLLTGTLAPAMRRNIETIRSSGLHLLDLINRVLDFSKIDAGAVRAVREPVDIAALARQVVEEARFSPAAAGLDLGVEAAPDLPGEIPCDRHGVRQLLTNLVGNAVKFTDAGSVRVRLAPKEGGVAIEVEDTGIGIPEDQIEAIFQPFVQVDGSITRRHGGTGLGLAICAELTRGMGGTIGAESTPGQGSVFRILLPAPGG